VRAGMDAGRVCAGSLHQEHTYTGPATACQAKPLCPYLTMLQGVIDSHLTMRLPILLLCLLLQVLPVIKRR
jgi:hypothetical protein